ncbi:MAG: PfkB family carbohydrate kinase [archaeon]
MYDVITVGSATVDMFAKTQFSELIKIISPKREIDLLAYPAGSKILIEELQYSVGGGGTNSAVALSRLGLKVAFLGKIGQGFHSELVLASLKKERVDTSLVCRDKSRTGYSIILDARGEDRTILAYKGSNNDLGYSEIRTSRLRTGWFYFSSMMGKSFRSMEKLAGFARKNGIKIAFNPSSYLAEMGADHLSHILKATEILILNDDEARLLVGDCPVLGLPRMLSLIGPRIVVVTMGSKGSLAYSGGKLYRVKPRKIRVVETTGAGDAFASGFLAGIIRKHDITFALQLGALNAESVIQHHGAKNNLLSWRKAVSGVSAIGVRCCPESPRG